MYSSAQVTKHLCELSGWSLSNLRIQKILYICQKVYIGRENGSPFINEQFQAWDYGPVIPDLYHSLKMFGSDNIIDVFYNTEEITNHKHCSFLQEAGKHLFNMTASQLVASTHRENGAWHKYYRPNIPCITIPNEAILEEYKAQNS